MITMITTMITTIVITINTITIDSQKFKNRYKKYSNIRSKELSNHSFKPNLTTDRIKPNTKDANY